MIFRRSRQKHSSLLFRLSVAFALLLVAAVVLIVAGAGYVWWQWSSVPVYWQANKRFQQSHSRKQLVHIADAAWNRWLSELTEPIANDPVDQPTTTGTGVPPAAAPRPPVAAGTRNDRSRSSAPSLAKGRGRAANLPEKLLSDTPGTRTIHLKPEAVNAWLDTRFHDWLANQGLHLPPQISDPMVSIEDGKPVVAFALHAPHLNQVISVVLDPTLRSDGTLSVRVDSIRGGRLPMPVNELIKKAHQFAPNRAGDIERALAILHGKSFEPVIKLDSRQARLVGMAIHRDSIDLTIRHEKVGTGLSHPPPSLPHR